jgi:hypothetical protein
MTVVTHVRLHTGYGEDFGPRADGFVILHTWEGPKLGTVAGLLAGPADWQDADSVLGSYNWVICTDGVVETVRADHASGGINPFSAGFRPASRLYQLADASEINNPNFFALQLCFFVSLAYVEANGWPPYMIDAAARAIIEEEQRIGREVVVAGHRDFQPPPERFDAGTIAFNLVMARYRELVGSTPEDDMQIVAIQPVKVTLRPGAVVRTAPNGSVAIGPLTESQNRTVYAVATVRADPPPGKTDPHWGVYRDKANNDRPLFYHSSDNLGGVEVQWPPAPVPAPQPVDCTEQVNAAKTATASKAEAQVQAWVATRPPITP